VGVVRARTGVGPVRAAPIPARPWRSRGCTLAGVGTVPVLSDDQVLIDALTPADAEAHWAGEDDEQARRFGWYPRRSTLERVQAHLVASEAQWREHGPSRTWAFRNATTRTLVGGCEVRLQDDATAQLSWWVFPAYRRRGIASRAVRLVTAYAFRALGVRQLEAFIEPDNAASRGVARNAGFVEVESVQEGGRHLVRHLLLPGAAGHGGSAAGTPQSPAEADGVQPQEARAAGIPEARPSVHWRDDRSEEVSSSPSASPMSDRTMIEVRLFKWPCRPTGVALARLLGEDAYGRWLGVTRGDPWWTADRSIGGTFRASFVKVVPHGTFWTACFNLVDPMVDVDIVLPARWADGVLEEVDLELDILRSADGSVRVRDRPEFDRVRTAWAMPDEVAAQALATCARLRELVALGAEPFGSVGRAWFSGFVTEAGATRP
jgi:RimJ/RimL family protein N-acetyltransferase